jgi:hypothetical protein
MNHIHVGEGIFLGIPVSNDRLERAYWIFRLEITVKIMTQLYKLESATPHPMAKKG